MLTGSSSVKVLMLVTLLLEQAWPRANLRLHQLTPSKNSVPPPTLYTMIPPYIGVFQESSSILISRVLTSLILSSRCVFTCRPLALTTCLPSNASCVMFKAPYTMLCISIHPLVRNLSSILMLIRVNVLTPVFLPLAIVCFLVTTSYLGLTNDNPHFLTPVKKPGTNVLLIWFLNLVGFSIFSWSFTT